VLQRWPRIYVRDADQRNFSSVDGVYGVSGLSNGSAVLGVGLPQWLIDLGPLGLSAIIGGTVVAALNHLLTARRERGKWLRELQVKANQDFFRAMQNVIDLVGQHVSRAIHYNDDRELPGHAATMDQLLVEFGNKWSDLVMVAEKEPGRSRKSSQIRCPSSGDSPFRFLV
jgi:hypothetical protein